MNDRFSSFRNVTSIELFFPSTRQQPFMRLALLRRAALLQVLVMVKMVSFVFRERSAGSCASLRSHRCFCTMLMHRLEQGTVSQADVWPISYQYRRHTSLFISCILEAEVRCACRVVGHDDGVWRTRSACQCHNTLDVICRTRPSLLRFRFNAAMRGEGFQPH
jgi:hypothetical protein